MTDWNNLSEKRKADRTKMAAILRDAVIAHGGTCEIRDWAVDFPDRGYRRLTCDITAPGGATIGVSFDGATSQPDTFVATWNTRGKLFINPIMGDVNRHHWSKLNRVCYSFDQLLLVITCDMDDFADGKGYMTEDDPRIQAMKASYEANGWAWYPEEEE